MGRGRQHIHGLVALAAWLAPALACAQTFDDIGGSFRPSVSYPVANGPYAPVVADLNNDGKPDLVVGNADAGSIQVLLGTGAGAFSAPTTLAAGNGAEGVAVGDFNGDGKPDLAVANLWASTVSVFLGNGAGGFTAAGSPATGANPHAVVVADFNKDGKADLATADGGAGVSILLGNGSGGFAAAVAYTSGSNPRDLRSADFNADGKPDLVVANEGGATFSILLGNGMGGLGPPATYPAGAAPQSVVVGDINADTKPDVMVASADGARVMVYVGVGDGSFTAKPELAAGNALAAVALADLNADGKPDLVMTRGDSQVEIRMGLGGGLFGASTEIGTGGRFARHAVADLDGDGKPDLVGASSPIGGAGLLVAINDSAPLSVAPSAAVDAGASYTLRKQPLWINRQTTGTYPADLPFSHAGYADIDRDGDIDFLRTFSNNADAFPVQVMVNDGSGNFSDQTAGRIVGAQPGVFVPRKVLAGDYNGDGWQDFFVLATGIDTPPFPGEVAQLFLSNGDGTLHYAPDLEPKVGYHHGGASADVDGNGTVDILVSDTPSYFLLNDGTGHFRRNISRLPTRPNGQPFFFFTAELVDVDGDGYIDLVTGGHEHEAIPTVIYWGASNGAYRASRSTTLPAVADMGVCLDFIVEDIDHDGRRDVLVDRTGSTQFYNGRYIQVLRQTAARVFADESAARISLDQTLLPFDFFRGQDINGDGHVDILVDDKNDVASGQYAWINNGAGVFTPYAGPVSLKPALPLLSVSDVSIAEGDAGTQQAVFTVSVSPVVDHPVSFDVYTDAGTATPGTDYQSAAAIGVVIPAGQASVNVPVNIVGDTQVEGHESFTLNLANALDARILRGQGRGRILNDDLAGLAIRDASVAEGTGGVTTLAFAIELTSPMPTPVFFDVATANGSATAGTDYLARSQTGRFMDAGRTRQWFEVSVLADAQAEADETFTVTLSNVSGAVLQDGSATGTILNDDGPALRAVRKPADATPATATARPATRRASRHPAVRRAPRTPPRG